MTSGKKRAKTVLFTVPCVLPAVGDPHFKISTPTLAMVSVVLDPHLINV